MSETASFNPSDEYIKALLSKVAYEGVTVNDSFLNLKSSEFSEAERIFLHDNYEIVDSYSDFSTGFKACWIRNKETNEVVYAIAGTDKFPSGLFDYGDDYDICKRGMATEQFIEAYNYYMQVANAQGTVINRIVEGKPESGAYLKIPVAVNYYKYYTVEEFVNTHEGTGYNNISLTGHSLGGHLAGLLGIITGHQTTIFNAPSYFEDAIGDYSPEYVFINADGTETTETLSSDYLGFIKKFFGSDLNQDSVTHIYNSNNASIIANLGWNWTNNKAVDCLNQNPGLKEAHSINSLCDAYYAYEIIKNYVTNSDAFFEDVEGTNSQIVFENIYKLYCLETSQVFSAIDYASSNFHDLYLTRLKNWLDEKTEAQVNVSSDVFNSSTSLITGTDGADIIYTGGGNDTVNSGNGNDVVYGIDLDGDMDASAGTTKVINLGAGNDTYHGSNAKDIVSTTGENTENDTNYIYLGAGADIFTGGAGADIVDAGILEKETGIEKQADLGAGNDVYLGGLANDKVNGGSGNNHILLGGGSDEYIGGDDIDIVDGGSGSLKVLNGISGISGKENMTRDITSDKAGDINIINLGGGDDIYYGGKGQDIVDGGSGDDRIYAGDGNNVIMGGSGNDTIEVGRGDNEIHAGTGGDTIKTGVGNNHIYLGNDDQQDIVFVYNIGGYTDHIYEFSSNDYIKLSCDVSSVNYIDNDMIWTLENGAKVHFHNFSVGDGENLTAQEYTSTMDISNADRLIQAMNSFSLSNSASTDTLSDPTQDVSEMYSLAASELNTKAA